MMSIPEIGDVDDLILDTDYHVVAMTVGVGGFLGIDETFVAVPSRRHHRQPAATSAA